VAPARPLFTVAICMALGALWGSWTHFHPAQLGLLLAPILLVPTLAEGRGTALVLAAMALLAAAGAPEPGAGGAGSWRPGWTSFGEDRGRLGSFDRSTCLPAGMVRAGEWMTAEGPGQELRQAEGPAGGGRLVRRRLVADEVRRRAPAAGSWPSPGPLLAAARGAGLRRLEDVRDPSVRGLLGALLFGERRGLDRAQVDGFTRTGLRHLLAISGLHVGLLAWLVAGPIAALLVNLLGWTGLRLAPEIPRALLVLALVPLGGGGPPVTRAALALALAAIAPRLTGRGPGGVGRRADALSLWSLALVLELASDPAGVHRPGVQLSYLATLALILATGPTSARLLERWPRLARVERTGASGRPRPDWLRVPANKLLRLMVSGVAASVVASLATLPVIAHNFGEVAPLGILATPLALPPLALLLAGGWWMVLAPAFAPQFLVELPAEALLGLVRLVDAAPGTPWVLPPRPFWLLALACGAALFALAGRRPRINMRVAQVSAGVLLLPWTLAPKGLEVLALDVGHGTAVLVRAPGSRTWLFDGGSRDRVGVDRSAIVPQLRRWDTGKLNVVLSHFHRDHAGGLPWVLERWPSALTFGAAMPGATMPLDLPEGSIDVPCRDDLKARLIRGQPTGGNEGSRSLELTYGETRVLLCGDAEQAGLARSLDRGDLGGPLDLLLLPHHGSASPHLAALLGVTRPDRIWLSCTERPAVAEELDRLGLAWSSTDRSGWLRALYGFRRPSPAIQDSRRTASNPD
jgi:competence protein ComEC